LRLSAASQPRFKFFRCVEKLLARNTATVNAVARAAIARLVDLFAHDGECVIQPLSLSIGFDISRARVMELDE